MRNEEIVERPAEQRTITKRYTEEAVRFIESHREQPFFLYLAHSMPHVPLFRSKEFEDKSLRGLYGDVIEELDWSVGQVLESLRQHQLDKNTIVFFSSDNGPWLTFNEQGGSAGLLREGKGSTWEGGMREPTIVWWPGKIPAASVSAELGSTMDIYTTAILLAGGKVPGDRVIDGVDLRPVLCETGESPRNTMFYYRGTRLMAVRHNQWKAHFITQPGYGGGPTSHDPPLLFNLNEDPSESYNLAEKHPQVIQQIRQVAGRHTEQMEPAPSQLEIPLR
jgi:arylsulfatase A